MGACCECGRHSSGEYWNTKQTISNGSSSNDPEVASNVSREGMVRSSTTATAFSRCRMSTPDGTPPKKPALGLSELNTDIVAHIIHLIHPMTIVRVVRVCRLLRKASAEVVAMRTRQMQTLHCLPQLQPLLLALCVGESAEAWRALPEAHST